MTAKYIKKILDANVYDVAEETPLDDATNLSQRLGNRVLLKREDMQSVFSFKLRGAYNRIYQLLKQKKVDGVIAASAGNHAQGVALAANHLGIKATIVMPVTTPDIKVKAVQARGGKTVLKGDTYDDAYDYAIKLSREQNLEFIHPYDHPDTIAGQGTIGMEILRQHSDDIHAVFIPVGGGGLLSGTSISVRAFSPDTRIYGAEPSGADDARRSLQTGHIVPSEDPETICEGLLTSLGDLTFSVIRENVRDILTCPDGITVRAMKVIADLLKVIVEPSGAVSLGAIMNSPGIFKGKKVGVILSGGNVDISKACTLFQGDYNPSKGGGPGK